MRSPWKVAITSFSRNFSGLVGAAVPDRHRPRAVLALRDLTLELEVLERVVLGVHREPVLVGVCRDSARAAPRRRACRRARGAGPSEGGAPGAPARRSAGPWPSCPCAPSARGSSRSRASPGSCRADPPRGESCLTVTGGRARSSRAIRAARRSSGTPAVAPASRSSCSEKPPVSTAIVSMPARPAASQSKVESPTITPSSAPAFSSAATTRSGSGFVASTSAELVQSSASSRASSRSR